MRKLSARRRASNPCELGSFLLAEQRYAGSSTHFDSDEAAVVRKRQDQPARTDPDGLQPPQKTSLACRTIEVIEFGLSCLVSITARAYSRSSRSSLLGKACATMKSDQAAEPFLYRVPAGLPRISIASPCEVRGKSHPSEMGQPA